MGVDQPKVSALLNGRLANFSSERLMRLLTALGQDVDITVRPKLRDRAHGRVRARRGARMRSEQENLRCLLSCKARRNAASVIRAGFAAVCARASHPRGERLPPPMIFAGAAGDSSGTRSAA